MRKIVIVGGSKGIGSAIVANLIENNEPSKPNTLLLRHFNG